MALVGENSAAVSTVSSPTNTGRKQSLRIFKELSRLSRPRRKFRRGWGRITIPKIGGMQWLSTETQFS